MNNFGKLAMLALAVCAAQPALASDKQDFVDCDGLKRPGKSDDGMRAQASRDGYGGMLFGLSQARPGERIAACTRALASPRLLPGQALRRAHLLRARAAAQIEARQPANALADLDLAEAATAQLRGDRFFRRSMGASLQLLRALAQAQSGELDAARTLAAEAAAVRPYSLAAQLIAASIRQTAGPAEAGAASIWLPLTRLDPSLSALALTLEAENGNFAAVRALRPAVTLEWPGTAPTLFQLANGSGPAADLGTSMMVAFASAYALAAGGDAEGARREFADLESALARVTPAPPAGQPAEAAPSAAALLGGLVEPHKKQIEARIALSEGRYEDAVALVVASPMPRNAAARELAEAMRAAAPAGTAVVLPDLAAAAPAPDAGRARRLADLADEALFALESPRAVIDYERARPNILGELVGAAFSMGTTLLDGIDRKDGFRSTGNPDGTIKVEFIGNTPSAPMVQEMTLLRAAEVAQAAGKAGFVIVDRNDYQRMLQMSRGGIPISSTPQGYKTELTIRLVDAGAEPERAFDAVALIDALGPLYYQEARPRVAAR